MALERRWSECITLEGNHIKKKKKRSGSQPEISKAAFSLTRPRRFRFQQMQMSAI